MKNDFLTIPDFPNYEINSELIVRNKTTGKILKPRIRRNANNFCVEFVIMRFNGKRSCRNLIFCRTCAESVANKPLDWQPIPSLDGKYEIAPNGDARNAKTKRHILKHRYKNGRFDYIFRIDGKSLCRSINSLLWEVHGIIPNLPHNTPVSISISKGNEKYFFHSINKASFFLAPRVFLGIGTIKLYLSRRYVTICDWKISYHEPEDFSKIKTPRRKWKTL